MANILDPMNGGDKESKPVTTKAETSIEKEIAAARKDLDQLQARQRAAADERMAAALRADAETMIRLEEEELALPTRIKVAKIRLASLRAQRYDGLVMVAQDRLAEAQEALAPVEAAFKRAQEEVLEARANTANARADLYSLKMDLSAAQREFEDLASVKDRGPVVRSQWQAGSHG